jgi:hypothetical protein
LFGTALYICGSNFSLLFVISVGFFRKHAKYIFHYEDEVAQQYTGPKMTKGKKPTQLLKQPMPAQMEPSRWKT